MKLFKGLIKALLYLVIAALLIVGGLRLFVVLNTRDQKKNIVELEALADRGKTVDAIIVLGAGVYEDGSLSPILKHRLDTALTAYFTGISDRILVTGDHRDGEYDEVDHMIDYLVSQGVAASDIQKDYRGFSTYESIYRAKYLYQIRSALIVTQNYHLARSLFIAKAYDIDAYGFAAEHPGEWTGKTIRVAREWIATLKDGYHSIVKTAADLTASE